MLASLPVQATFRTIIFREGQRCVSDANCRTQGHHEGTLWRLSWAEKSTNTEPVLEAHPKTGGCPVALEAHASESQPQSPELPEHHPGCAKESQPLRVRDLPFGGFGGFGSRGFVRFKAKTERSKQQTWNLHKGSWNMMFFLRRPLCRCQIDFWEEYPQNLNPISPSKNGITRNLANPSTFGGMSRRVESSKLPSHRVPKKGHSKGQIGCTSWWRTNLC